MSKILSRSEPPRYDLKKLHENPERCSHDPVHSGYDGAFLDCLKATLDEIRQDLKENSE